MDFNIDQFSPMQDAGTDKATETPAFITKMNNCYVNSGNIVPIQLPKGDIPTGWRIIKEIHTADAVICEVSTSVLSDTFTVIYNKKTRHWEPVAPPLGGLVYDGSKVYSGITGEILLCNLLAGLERSAWSTTTFAAAPAKCQISTNGKYILYLETGTQPKMSRDGGVSFVTLNQYGGMLGDVIDFLTTPTFDIMFLLFAGTLWKSSDFGVTWVQETSGAFLRMSWCQGQSIYLQTSSTTGVLYNYYTGQKSTPAKQGAAIDNQFWDNYYFTLLSGGVLYTKAGTQDFKETTFRCAARFSDEPGTATKWAQVSQGRWFDETNKEIKPKAGRIVYLCRTRGVQVEKNGDFYVVYKDDKLIGSISGADQSRYNSDGSSIADFVMEDSWIIGVTASEHLVFRSAYYRKNSEYTALSVGRERLVGIKKMSLADGAISVVTDNMTAYNLASYYAAKKAGSGELYANDFWYSQMGDWAVPFCKATIRTNPASKYIGVPTKRNFNVTQWSGSGWTGIAFFDSSEDTSGMNISNAYMAGANTSTLDPTSIFLWSGYFLDFQSTISLTEDDCIVGAGGGATYTGKIIKVPITTLGTIATNNCDTGTVTVLGSDMWIDGITEDWRKHGARGPVKYFYGAIIYEGLSHSNSYYTWINDEQQIKVDPMFYVGTVAVKPINKLGAEVSPIASGLAYQGVFYPIVPSFTKIEIIKCQAIVYSVETGIYACYWAGAGTRPTIELVSSDGGLQFGSYFNFSAAPATAEILYADTEGIKKRNLISSTTTKMKTGSSTAFMSIVNSFGVVIDGYVNLMGCSAAPNGKLYQIIPSLSSASALTLSGDDVPKGTYSMIANRHMDFETALVDPDTADEVLVFKDQSGMLYKKKQQSFSVPFFDTDIHSGISGAYTYFPDFASMFNARFAMVGGFELTGEDQVVNGGMTTLTGWDYKGASTDGTKMTLTPLATSYIKQAVTKDCIVVASVNDPTFISGTDSAAIIKISTGNYKVIFTTPTKNVEIHAKPNFKSANLVITAVHAYTIERCDTSVFISDQANYEEFYSGTGSIQKLPSLGIKFNGMIPIGDSLYLVRDGSTAKISETGSTTNPFAVVEEFVRQGGQFPFKCLQTFAVVRKATSKGQDTGDVYLFSGTDYSKMNTVWNTTYDRPFSFNEVFSAELNGMTILSQNNRAIVLGDSGRNLSIETHQEVEKIGELELGGSLSGDINEDVFVTQGEHSDVTVRVTGGKPNLFKRLRKVKILPEQECTMVVGDVVVTPFNGAAAFNATGREIDVVIDIASDSFIEGMQFTAELTMPTARR